MNVARTIQSLEDAGLAGLHLEDQVNPKRCGHLDGKAVVDDGRDGAGASAPRSRPAATRTSSSAPAPTPRASKGLDAAIDRAKAYVDAGADVIFPEALRTTARVRAVPRRGRRADAREHDRVRQDASCSPRSSSRDSASTSVIYPVTTLRLAMGAVESGLRDDRTSGHAGRPARRDADTARGSTSSSTTSDYNEFDSDIFNFTLDRRQSMTRHRSIRRSTRASPASSSTPPRSPRWCPETNSLTYRGYPVQELAAHCSFEEVAYLLWHGELPTDARAGAVHAARARRAAARPLAAVAASAKLPDELPPDGRGAHRGQLPRRRGSRRGRQRRAPANCAQGAADDGGAADDRRRRHAPPPRPRADRAAPATWASPRTSSTCASARCPTPEIVRRSRSR